MGYVWGFSNEAHEVKTILEQTEAPSQSWEFAIRSMSNG